MESKYSPAELEEILAQHALWFTGDGGKRANLRGAYLRYANLRGANLRGANLRGAYLRYANLRGANLRGADLRYADLSDADLRDADLSGADLRYADLSGANLRDADLRDAYLPCPPMLLLAEWGTVPDELCVELMRYDAANHPDPKAFGVWASGGACPYTNLRTQRAANFTERPKLWSYGPAKSAFALMEMLIREKCSDSDYHIKEAGDGE